VQQGEFAEILQEQLDRISAVLGVKTNEYATQEDQLKNIRAAATLMEEPLPKSVAGTMVKHTVSIYHMIKSGKQFPMEVWDEKITDHIIWLILLKATLHEGAQTTLTE
jgi:hypothetical protein